MNNIDQNTDFETRSLDNNLYKRKSFRTQMVQH
jgi:hypothetical protein